MSNGLKRLGGDIRWSVPNSSKVKWNSSWEDKVVAAVEVEEVVRGLSRPIDLLGLSRGDGRGWRMGSGVVARGGGEAARRDIGGRGGAAHCGLERGRL